MDLPPTRRLLSRAFVDGALAAVLLVLAEVQLLTGWNAGGVGVPTTSGQSLRALLVVAATAPLAWRRARPLTVVSLVCASVVVQVLAVGPYVPFLGGLLPMCIANYSAAVYGGRWRLAGLAAVGVTEAVIVTVIPEEQAVGELLFGIFVVLGTWIVGDVVRTRLHRADRVVDAAQSLLAAREASARAARAEERARIARELHDVIAHSVSVMGVQAGAARALMDTDPDAARDALRRVEACARDSVAELQRLLAVLRERDDRAGERAPQPGLSDLPRLVEQVRAAGLPVRLNMSGDAALTAGVDLAAYRIVQEALTNALKHAKAPTVVTVQCRDDRVALEVRDAGTRRGGASNADGHGLIGMQERAHLYGGTLEAGPHPEGGFLVRACLPRLRDPLARETV